MIGLATPMPIGQPVLRPLSEVIIAQTHTRIADVARKGNAIAIRIEAHASRIPGRMVLVNLDRQSKDSRLHSLAYRNQRKAS
jgi:hypothetical protein